MIVGFPGEEKDGTTSFEYLIGTATIRHTNGHFML